MTNLTKAIESGQAPDALVRRMMELEKEKKDLEGQIKKEESNLLTLDKEQVVFWLNQFKGGSIEDEEFCRMVIDLFVNSVTVWDDDDDYLKVTIAYNLTNLPTKTYRLGKDGRVSDFTSNAPVSDARYKKGRQDLYLEHKYKQRQISVPTSDDISCLAGGHDHELYARLRGTL